MAYSPLEIFGYIKRERRLPPIDAILANIGFRRNHPNLPHKIQIEHTTSCNFKCITCSRTTWSNANPMDPRLNKNMTLDQFKAIHQKIPTLREVQMQGMGETFLNPHLKDILDYCKANRIAVTTTTNASLMDKNSNLSLIGAFKSIFFSMDSATARNFAEIRVGGQLNRTIENIGRAVQEKKKHNYKTVICINSVITHLNYTEIPAMVEIARNLGVDKIGFVEVEHWMTPGEKGYDAEDKFINSARVKSIEIKKIIDEQKAKYSSKKFEISHLGPEKIKPRCTWPFTSAFITAEGYVTPCCIRPDPTVINFGNINEKSFEEIWNSPQYVDFRKSMAAGESNPICDNCPS